MIPGILTLTTVAKIASNPYVMPAAIGIVLESVSDALTGGTHTNSDEGAKIVAVIGGGLTLEYLVQKVEPWLMKPSVIVMWITYIM